MCLAAWLWWGGPELATFSPSPRLLSPDEKFLPETQVKNSRPLQRRVKILKQHTEMESGTRQHVLHPRSSLLMQEEQAGQGPLPSKGHCLGPVRFTGVHELGLPVPFQGTRRQRCSSWPGERICSQLNCGSCRGRVSQRDAF